MLVADFMVPSYPLFPSSSSSFLFLDRSHLAFPGLWLHPNLQLVGTTTTHVLGQKALMILLGTIERTSGLDTGIQRFSRKRQLPLMHDIFGTFLLFVVQVPNSRSILTFALGMVGVMHLGPGYHQQGFGVVLDASIRGIFRLATSVSHDATGNPVHL
jgi:hypothetical protein